MGGGAASKTELVRLVDVLWIITGRGGMGGAAALAESVPAPDSDPAGTGGRGTEGGLTRGIVFIWAFSASPNAFFVVGTRNGSGTHHSLNFCLFRIDHILYSHTPAANSTMADTAAIAAVAPLVRPNFDGITRLWPDAALAAPGLAVGAGPCWIGVA